MSQRKSSQKFQRLEQERQISFKISQIDGQNDLNEKLISREERQITDNDFQSLYHSTISQGIDLKWEDINVSVQKKKQSVQILHDITGFAKKGEVTAIMGPSGAGKTTLLGLLGKRVNNTKKFKVSGKLSMNGEEYDQKMFSKYASFIQQHDILLETLTVRESIEFTANLKLKGNKQQIQGRVDEVIKTLQLDRCANTVIGGTWVKGISGGERKRVCIGLELVTDPQVLILDEPTSGLDSFTAWIVINMVKGLAKNQGKTIIFTIHSPNSEILELFDKVILMKKGHTIYQGSAGQNVVQYLEQVGETVPKQMNPADFFMTLLQKQNLETKFNNETYVAKQQNMILDQINKLSNKYDPDQLPSKDSHKAFKTELMIVTKRGFINYVRNPQLLWGKTFQLIFMSVFLNFLWWQSAIIPEQGNESLQHYFSKTLLRYWQNVTGLLFAFGFCPVLSLLSSQTLSMPLERPVFLKEINGKTYKSLSYFTSRCINEIPFMIIFPLVFTTSLYFGTGMREGGYGLTLVIMLVITTLGHGMGMLNGSIFKDQVTAVGLTSLWLLPLSVLGGFYTNYNTMAPWLKTISYISPFKYIFECLMVNQFQGTKMENYVNQQFGFTFGLGNCIAVLCGMSVFFHVLALISFKLQSKTMVV